MGMDVLRLALTEKGEWKMVIFLSGLERTWNFKSEFSKLWSISGIKKNFSKKYLHNNLFTKRIYSGKRTFISMPFPISLSTTTRTIISITMSTPTIMTSGFW